MKNLIHSISKTTQDHNLVKYAVKKIVRKALGKQVQPSKFKTEPSKK